MVRQMPIHAEREYRELNEPADSENAGVGQPFLVGVAVLDKPDATA